MHQPATSPGDHQPVPLRPVAVDRPLSRVPAPATPFFGREGEIAALTALLRHRDARLVTLVGPGGVGKTRLAVQIATLLGDAFADGVRYVELAGVRDPALVGSEIARASGDRSAEGAAAAFRDFDGVLVIDNFEHVIEAAPLLADMVAACPRLAVLATSRAPLHLSAERVVPVEPFPVPSAVPPAGVKALERLAAVQVFVDRARARRHDFALTPANAPAVAAICAALGGLPLAIVLAASHVDVLSPASLLDRLQSRQPLPARGPLDMPARHRSVAAAIAWSDDLLDAPARTALRRLAVFVGGFTLDAAAAVLDPQRDALPAVSALVGASLLTASDAGDGTTRYLMLEPIREYALERLAAGGDGEHGAEADARDRHAAWCAELATWSDWAWFMEVPEGAPRLARLDAEAGNLRAALDWLHRRGDHVGLLRMAMCLGGLWVVLGHPREGIRWLETGLRDGREIPQDVRARSLATLSWVLNTAGEPKQALALAEQSLAIWRELDNPVCLAQALILCGVPALRVEGRAQDAAGWFEDGLAALAGVETPGWVVNMRAMVQLQLAMDALSRGDVAEAERRLHAVRAEEHARGFDMGGSYVYGPTLALGLADVARAQGDAETALDLYRRVLPAARLAHNQRGLCHALGGVAGALAALGKVDAAARLFGACEAHHERLGYRFDEAFDRQRACGLPEPWLRGGDGFGHWQRLRDTVRRLPPLPAIRDGDAAARAWADGRSLSIDAAIELALATEAGEPPPASHALSDREVQVLRLLVEGMTDSQIAAALFISRRTAATHVRHIYDKLGVSSRAGAAAWAVRHGIA